MRADRTLPAQRGFTLIEAIVVIVITGIIAAMIGSFIRAPVDAYADTRRRAQMTDTADTALRRIGRDVRTALPNSLRQPAGGGACFEFLPTVAGGRYRVAQDGAGNGDILDFTAVDSSFDVLAETGNAAAGNLVAIYNLGISGADAYAGDTTATIVAASAAHIALNPGKQFQFPSPGNRFQVIPNSSTVYEWDSVGQRLVRFNQAIAPGTPATCPAIPAGAAVLAANVGDAAFTYVPGVTRRSGLLTLQIALTQGGESVTLIHEIHVDNVP